MTSRKSIALIAHDNCKTDLIDWARYNRGILSEHDLCATGTTGRLLTQELSLPVKRFLSGPLGGDQQCCRRATATARRQPMNRRRLFLVAVSGMVLSGVTRAWPGTPQLRRLLSAAESEYGRVLAAEPPALPSGDQIALVRRFAPRLFTTASEPFALRDAAAILHPTAPLIAYHLFWEDDIDFPDDDEPCDHELVWIRYVDCGTKVEQVWTYFHGRLLRGPAGPTQERPRVNVQWGKHGSLPENWREQRIRPFLTELPDGIPQSLRPIPLRKYLEGSYRKLSTKGRRLRHHPLPATAGWPDRFTGSREDFLSFPREVDMRPMLDERTILVSRFNNATLSRRVIAYNFRPKTEWPGEN